MGPWMGPHYKAKPVVDLRANIRLGWQKLVVTNILEHNTSAFIPTIKSFYNTCPWLKIV
jgi:hypothetical protein